MLYLYYFKAEPVQANNVTKPAWASKPDNNTKPKSADLRAVYSLGTSHLHIKIAHTGNERLVNVDIKRPVLFKSTLSSFSYTNSKLLANNLFERSNVSLNNLLAFINNEHQKGRHYWGNLFSLNNFKLKLKTCQWRTSARVLVDSCNLEHSVDAISLIDFLIRLYNDKFPFGFESPVSSQPGFTKSIQLKVSVKSFNFFLLFRQQYLLVLQLDNLSFLKTLKVIITRQAPLLFFQVKEKKMISIINYLKITVFLVAALLNQF